jgi:hypothetical protein
MPNETIPWTRCSAFHRLKRLLFLCEAVEDTLGSIIDFPQAGSRQAQFVSCMDKSNISVINSNGSQVRSDSRCIILCQESRSTQVGS